MILDKEEQEDLAELLENVVGFLDQIEKSNTNVGMKLCDKMNGWLVKLGK